MKLQIEDGRKKSPQEDTVWTPDDPLESHEKKLARYAKAKARSQAVSQYIINDSGLEGNIFKQGNAVRNCASFLVFRHYFTIGKFNLHQTFFCQKHLLCALCAIRRAAKQLRAYLEKTEIVLSENPNTKLIFGTLTVKNGDDLLERFFHLQNNYRKMVQRRRNLLKKTNRNKLFTVFGDFIGLVGTFEITNKGKGWHPHAHFIALVDENYDCVQGKKDLKKEWEALTLDSHQADLRDITGDKVKSFVEVFKYALKHNDMTVPDQVHAAINMAKKRLIFSFGAFFGVKVPEDLNDEIEPNMEDLPYVEMIYKYSATFGYQLQSSIKQDPPQ